MSRNLNPAIPNERVASLGAELEHVVNNPAFDRLAFMFEATLPEPGDENRLPQLAEVAATHWNFRKGAERQATNWNVAELGDPASPRGRQVFRYTGSLGLVASSHPTLASYTRGLVTGAANFAPLLRATYLEEQGVEIGRYDLLGTSSRDLLDKERQTVAEYAPGATTEFDLMCAAAVRVWEAKKSDELKLEPDQVGYDHIGNPKVVMYETKAKKLVAVYDAPAPVGQLRPNTFDTMNFWRSVAAEQGNEIGEHDNILNSTNAFYGPFQHLAACQGLTLPTGADVETIGFSAQYGGATRLPSQLLNETKSLVDAAVRFDAALASASLVAN